MVETILIDPVDRQWTLAKSLTNSNIQTAVGNNAVSVT